MKAWAIKATIIRGAGREEPYVFTVMTEDDWSDEIAKGLASIILTEGRYLSHRIVEATTSTSTPLNVCHPECYNQFTVEALRSRKMVRMEGCYKEREGR